MILDKLTYLNWLCPFAFWNSASVFWCLLYFV